MSATNQTFNIKDLLSNGPYLIPIYQRNYAWESAEVKQLILDTADYAVNHPSWDYYIGTLIVLNDAIRGQYETIDGQQRLTTLYIILCALRNWDGLDVDLGWFHQEVLSFDNRENSCRSLLSIYENDGIPDEQKEYEQHIIAIYQTIRPAIDSIQDDFGISIKDYIEYFLFHVKILRIEVPEDINKNHYFEVMNSRGVQLEQHEVVKADMMEYLQSSISDMFVFRRIWDACSNMERYVQMNFLPEERCILFGDEWTSEPASDFDVISASFPGVDDQKERILSLRTILDSFESGNKVEQLSKGISKSSSRLNEDQFYSVINFQNFLLHVLKIFFDSKGLPIKENGKDIIPLDDKQLRATFQSILKKVDDKISFVKEFAMCLLRCRYLFDMYVVRRQNNQWCLKKLRSTESDGSRHAYYVVSFGVRETTDVSHEEAILLLSMFHVSTPTMNYKNWLHGVLHFVYHADHLSMKEFIDFLKKMARTFMLDRYLATKDNVVDFMDMIYYNGMEASHQIENADWSLIDQGVAVENFVFNFYDYLLWQEKHPEKFEFSYRTSVEHFYPQHPNGDNEYLDSVPLNSFGNLCLISSSVNSSFSNNMPEAKYGNFKNTASILAQSLKLQEMFQVVDDNEQKGVKPWAEEDINRAEEYAIGLFKKYLCHNEHYSSLDSTSLDS